MPKPLISFVVLNWNGIDDTLKCLDAIRAQTIENFEIIVVDNGSVDEQKTVLQQIDDIKLIDLPMNAGFTGGQIAAFKVANGDFIALINNDAVIAKDWAEVAIGVMHRHKKAAAVGGRAYQWEESKNQNPFDESSPFYSYQVVSPVTGHAKTATYGDKECFVNSISGSGVLLRKKAIKDTGYFYDRFFAYYEETDLFARLKRANWQIIYSPDVKAWHQVAKSTRSKPRFYLYQMHRNRFIYAMRNSDQPFRKRFWRYYFGEVLTATKFVLTHSAEGSLEQRSLIKAAIWNVFHIAPTIMSRKEVTALGDSYSAKLLADKGESISVIISCYNYGEYVAEAIESVLTQTLPPDEIIVVNDGSTDDSLQAIKKYRSAVKIINQKNNGVIAARNKGLHMANGDWVIFLDADDTIDKKYIEKLYGEARVINSDVVYSGMKMTGHYSEIFDSRPFTAHSLKNGNYINNAALMRRELVLKAGGYKKEMDLGYEDWELYLALAELKAHFWHVNEPLLYYRRHQTTSRDIESQQYLQHARKEIRRLHPEMFTFRHRLYDILYTLLTFHQRRSLWKLLKDIRYIFVKRIDTVGERNIIVNKSVGFLRLLTAGRFDTVWQKIKLNFWKVVKK